MHRPEPGVARAGAPVRDQARDLDRQAGATAARIRASPSSGSSGPSARQPQRELVAEAVDDVDRPVAGALERQLGQVGELLDDELPDERVVDLDLIRVNAHQPKP